MNGISWRSRVVWLLRAGTSDFTHVGIVSVRDGEAFIVHASPNAGENGAGMVVEERWDVALGPDRVTGGAVYRLRRENHTVDEGVRLEAERYAAAALPFDHEFDLTTADRLYCTELVWRAYEKFGIDLRPPDLGTYLFPADLLRSSMLREVARF